MERRLSGVGVGLSAPKKPAPREGSALSQEPMLPAGVQEDHLLPHRYDVYSSDYHSVHWVRASLLGLAPGNLNSLPNYTFRSAASEREPPEIVTSHWLPILWANSRLADCPPGDFIVLGDWVPLYTPEKLKEHLLRAYATYGEEKVPGLTAVVPVDLPLGTD